MQHHLINFVVKRDASLDEETAAFFPRVALSPAYVSNNAAVSPVLEIRVNREHEFQPTIDPDLELTRLHG